jgi:inner membrane protein
METTPVNLIERFNRWLSESIMVKLASIGFLVLILLIPSAWVESIIREREYRADSVVEEIASKWSGQQTVNGPLLVIPYIYRYEAEVEHEREVNGKTVIEKKKEMQARTERAYFLPEKLAVNGTVQPETRGRGIFEAVVYKSVVDLKATFNVPSFENQKIPDADILWAEAYMALGIKDLRGISDNPTLLVGGKPCVGEPDNTLNYFAEYDGNEGKGYTAGGNGVIVKLPWKSAMDFSGDVAMTLSLKGSSSLYFAPVGKTTDVSLSGPWASPSFDGKFLPTDPKIDEQGFSASWKILHYNRPFSQSWFGEEKNLTGSDFGAKLLIPVDQYQKSMRSAKYGVLVIMLTFVSLFMVEIMRKVRIHPFQYILIGAALIIYYTLLLSFSEQVGYNWAYLISTVATVALIGLYSTTFLKSRVLVATFTALLTFFYTFIFVIIQLQDFSLLLGSIGLFLIIGSIMYFSRSIKWYKTEAAV